MPHVTVEYTDNLREEGNIKQLLRKINETLLEERDVFPVGGIRIRAIELKDYLVADGTGKNDAFVHVILKIGKGRSGEVKKRVCDQLFKIMEDHFQELFQHRYLALSLELYEFLYPTYKKNNIHERYR